jgi:hypothetical protein
MRLKFFFSFNAEALWNLFQTKFDMPSYGTLLAKGGPIEWVQLLITFCNAQEQKYKLGLFFSCSGGQFGRKEIGIFFRIKSCQSQ